MDTIGDKLNSISETKANIKQAIQDMGVSDVGDVFVTYPDKIREIINPSDYYTKSEIDSMMTGKAPTNHASTNTIYGVGSSTSYGHVKVVSGDLNGKSADDGYAASQSHSHSQYAPKNHAFTDATYGGAAKKLYGHVKLATGDLNGKEYTDGIAAASAHTHSQYLLKTGGIMTGRLQMEGNSNSSNIEFNPTEDTENCGILTWNYSSGDEKMSIIAPEEPTTAQGPQFRIRSNNGSLLYSGNLALEQPGMITMWAGTTAPSGWLLCNGSTINLTKTMSQPDDYDFLLNGLYYYATDRIYGKLIKVIKNIYGLISVSSSESQAVLPNFCGMFPLGAGTGKVNTGTSEQYNPNPNFALGEGGWNQINGYSGEYSHILSTKEMTHKHSLSDDGLGVSGGASFGDNTNSAGGGTVAYNVTRHNNTPPYTVVNFIIKY